MAVYFLNMSCTVVETYGGNGCSRAVFFLCKKYFLGTVTRIYDLFVNLHYSKIIYWQFKFLFYLSFLCIPLSFLFLSFVLVFKNILADPPGHMSCPERTPPWVCSHVTWGTQVCSLPWEPSLGWSSHGSALRC